MNNKNTTNQEDIPEFINLEEYKNLLCELDSLEENLFSVSEITVKLELPEIVTETIKLISNVFYRIPTERYLQHCIISSIMADLDIFLQYDDIYKKLYKLLKKLDEKEISECKP